MILISFTLVCRKDTEYDVYCFARDDGTKSVLASPEADLGALESSEKKNEILNFGFSYIFDPG